MFSIFDILSRHFVNCVCHISSQTHATCSSHLGPWVSGQGINFPRHNLPPCLMSNGLRRTQCPAGLYLVTDNPIVYHHGTIDRSGLVNIHLMHRYNQNSILLSYFVSKTHHLKTVQAPIAYRVLFPCENLERNDSIIFEIFVFFKNIFLKIFSGFPKFLKFLYFENKCSPW